MRTAPVSCCLAQAPRSFQLQIRLQHFTTRVRSWMSGATAGAAADGQAHNLLWELQGMATAACEE